MESNSLKIKIDSSEAVKASDNLNKLNSTSKSTEKQNNTLVGTNKLLFDSFSKGNIAIGATVTAMSLLVKKGIEYAASIEKLTNGLTTLNVMTSKNIASNGQALTLEEKYNIARKESIETMQQLNKVNLETPHSLEETVQIYKSMYTSMKNVGVSSEQMIDLTKKLSIAAGSSGIEFQQLLSGIDGLATGTVEVSSELGRFLKSIGLSNEELKKSSNIYDTINNKLKDVKSIQGYDEAVSNLTNSLNQLTGALVEPFFDDVKSGINGLAGLFNELTTSVTLFYDKFKSISELSSKDQLNKRAIEVSEKIAQLQEDLKDPGMFQTTGKLSAELRAANLELLSINQQYDKMNQSSTKQLVAIGTTRNDADIIKIMGTEYQKLNQTIEDNANALKKAGATEKEINDYRLKATQEFNEKQNKTKVVAVKETNDELLKLEKEHQENIRKVTQDAKDMITSDIDKLANEYIAMYSIVKDTLSPDELNKLNEAFQQRAEDITGVTDLLKEAQEITTSEIDKINDKYMQMYEVAKNNPMFDDEKMKLFYEKWQKAIEDTKDKMDFSKSVKLDTEGENRSIAKISKGFDELNDASKQYQDNKVKAGKDTTKLAINEEQYRKDQLNGYANISSAMADMYEKGSKEAAAFQSVSTALALVEATRAILTQGTGDPYSAIPRMIAMAAMVGSLMSNIGVAFGMNKETVSTSSDSISSQAANDGTGTTLGDSKKTSDSIKNSLSILEDFAKPEFRLSQQMAYYLQSIDSKIGGVSSLLVQTGGYAFGEGFTPKATDTGWQTPFKIGDTSKINSTLQSIQTIIDPALGIASTLAKKLGGDGMFNNVMDVLSGKTLTNKLISGLMGKTSTTSSTKLTDAGIYFANQLLGNAKDEFYGSMYQTIQKKTTTTSKSWFSSSTSTKKKITTSFQGMSGNTETERQFSLILTSLYDSVALAGEALGESGERIQNQLNNFVVSLGKISLKGLSGTQIQEKLTAIFGKLGDKLASTTFPELVGFQEIGEGLFTTLTKVSSGMEQANYFIERLGSTFEKTNFKDIINKQGEIGFEALYQSILKIEKQTNFNNILSTLSGTAEELYQSYLTLDLMRDRLSFFGKGLDALSISIIQGAGGLEGLSDGISSYIENFYSSTEQQTLKISELTQLLNRAGISTIPTSISGFRKLIESIDTSSESGQKLYGNLLSLSGAFSDVYSDIEDERTSLLTDITSFVKDLRGSVTTLSSGTTFKTFANSFNEMIDAIANGSSNLNEIGQTTLTTAQSYLDTVAKTASTSQELQFAKQIVANKLASVTNAPDITLGTINETLKISFNENSVIVNELKAMREQLSYLNGLNTTQAATGLKVLSATRALIS